MRKRRWRVTVAATVALAGCVYAAFGLWPLVAAPDEPGTYVGSRSAGPVTITYIQCIPARGGFAIWRDQFVLMAEYGCRP